jgi:hypothetical protein
MRLPILIKKNHHAKPPQNINSRSRLTHFAGEKKFQFLTILASLLLILQLTGCEDRGVVGSTLPGTGLKVTVDTFRINAINPVQLTAITGNQRYFSAGKFHDPLFGSVNISGLIEPLLASKDSSHSFGKDTKMMLKLFIHNKGVYGDSIGTEHFKLVAINQIWRAKQWNIHKKIHLVSGSTVGTFSVSNQDSVMIPLSDKFVQKYKTFYERTDTARNKDYLDQFHGLAVVPQNAQKIIAFDPFRSGLIIIDMNVHTDSTVQRDTLKNIGLRYWAYSLSRSDSSSNSSATIKVYNTLENIANFHFSLSSNQINPNNISKVELIISRPQQQLEASISQAGPHAVRPPNDTLKLYLSGADELLESLDPGNGRPQSYVNGIYGKTDSAYHFNVTRQIGWIFSPDSSRSFYIVPNFTDGIIRSSLLYNSKAAGHDVPKIIITHTHNK